MNNEKGLTLVELLIAIVIVGIIIVPLLTIMTGTFTRTMSHEKETEIAYIAQEVMEKVMNQQEPNSLEKGIYCWSNVSVDCVDDSSDLPAPYNDISASENVTVLVEVKKYGFNDIKGFNEVTVIVRNEGSVVNGPGEIARKENKIELVTVVRSDD